MTKNLHFCTLDQLYKIKYEENDRYYIINTFRTGFIPSLYPGDIINLNYRNKKKKDSFLKQGKVLAVVPIQFEDIPEYGKYEIKYSYDHREFKPEHWFFEIVIKKWSITHLKHLKGVSCEKGIS